MRVCQTQLSSHFEVTLHCFSVFVSLYVTEYKHGAKETKSFKIKVGSLLQTGVYIFLKCVLAGLCILLNLIPIFCRHFVAGQLNLCLYLSYH